MASYIGNKPVAGEFKRLDSIAGQFNGVLTSFSLNFNSVSVSAGDASQLIVSLDGVVQEPLGAYTLGVGGSTIVFGTAPVAGSTCHIVQLGGVGGTITGTLTDNIVTTTKIGAGAVTSDRITIDGDILFPDGIVAKFGSDSDLRIYSSGTNSFITHGTSSAGDLKILGENIEIGNSAAVKNFKAFSGAQTILYHNGNTRLTTSLNGIDVAGSMTTTGDLFVGTSDYGDKLNVTGTGHFTGNVTLSRQTNDSGSTGLTFEKTRSTSVNGNTLVQSGDQLGYVAFRGNDGDQFLDGAYILAFVDSSPANNDMPTNLQFWTTGDGTSSPTERMRIAQDGRVGIGLGGSNPSYMLHVDGGSNPAARFQQNNSTVQIGEFSSGAVIWMDGSNGDLSGSDYFGIHALSTTDLSFSADGGEIRMTMKNDGKLGIGTTNPSEKLEVAGTALVENAKLKAISDTKTLSNTAVDVFVYDTRKDSDGGAWRKRTQNTSWYNETLNTSTRGSRREFPAVAVIVAEAQNITIYDGDDPDMPMWMVFNGLNHGTSYTWFGTSYSGEDTTCVSMLNAKLCIGVQGSVSSVSGLCTVHFIDEIFKKYGGATGFVRRPIAYRNQSFQVQLYSPYNLIDKNIRGVAMKVLPNAPIDPDNGLPVPTIAVSTAQGISVIRDNQKDIWDITAAAGSSYNPTNYIDFTESGKIIFDQDNSKRSIFYMDIPDSDTQSTTNDGVIFDKIIAKHYPTAPNDMPAYLGDGVLDLISAKGESQVFRATTGQLTLVDPDKFRPMHTSTCFIGNDYNTGWMQGASKLSLSSTDDTDITGSSKLTGNLYSGFSVTGGGFTVNGNGTVSVTNGNGSVDGILTSPSFNLVIGKRYIIDIQASGTTGTGIGIYLNGAGGPNGYLWNRRFEFVATQVQNTFFLYRYLGHNGSGTLDKAVVYEAEANRSVYGQAPLYGDGDGLQVFGTVVKTAVETGADLVSYRSNGSSFLSQPFAGGLDISGNKDVSFTWWQRHNGGGGVYEGWKISEDALDQPAYDNVVVSVMHEVSSDQILVRGKDITGAGVANGIISKEWVCMTLNIDTNGEIKFYTNGELSFSTTGTLFTPTDRHSLRILQWSYDSTNYYCTNSDITMFRTSNTLPNAQRIRKCYEQERPLFAANAKATIDGVETFVRAIAYDDDTDELHVGTLSGRSVFRGLNRIDSTSDSISKAISASNGLVVEE